MKIRKEQEGILFSMRMQHGVLVAVLEVRGQTQKEAATELGISLGTFNKMVGLKCVPVFHTKNGQELAERLENWSTLPVERIFPELFFTEEFKREAKKTLKVTRPFQLILNQRGGSITLALPASVKPYKSPKKKKGGVKRKKAGEKRNSKKTKAR